MSPTPFYRVRLVFWLLAAGLLLGISISGCGAGEPAQVAPAANTVQPSQGTSESAQSAPVGEALPPADAASDGSPTPAAPSVITLTWWLPPYLSPEGDSAAGRLVAEQLRAFEDANANVVVSAVPKSSRGKGGLLDFLLAAQKVAPAVLPDLVTLNSDELPAAMRSNLLQPLDGLLPAELVADLYPFAAYVGRYQERRVAVPLDADLLHLVADTDTVDVPPRTWDDLLAETKTWAFATGTEKNPGRSFLIQYSAAGGVLGDRTTSFVLNEDVLFQVLDLYQRGRAGGVIPSQVLGLENPEATWALFESGRVDLASVPATRFLAARGSRAGMTHGYLPTPDGNPATIADGWTLGVVATDPVRQTLAVALLETLLQPEFSAELTQASNRLPTRRAALALWNQEDPYTSFLGWQLESAGLFPVDSTYARVAEILAQAQRAVLSGDLSAREATDQAMDLAGAEG